MNHMDRYLARHVVFGVLAVLGAVGALVALFALIDELQDDDARYHLAQALWYVLLTFPRRIYELLPYAVFLGTLIGLGNLASHSELVVLRAAGVSPGRIFASITLPAGMFLLLGLAIGELLAPWGEERAETFKTQQLQAQGDQTVWLAEGHWYREGRLYMQVDGFGEGGELMGVRQYRFDEDMRLSAAQRAERAVYHPGTPGFWILHDVVSTRFEPSRTEIERLDSLRWDGHVDPHLLRVSVLVEPRKLSLRNLLGQIRYMNREGLDPASYRLAFWSKLMQPLAVLGLALLALGFILGPLRQVGIGVRLTVGVLVGLTFKYLQDLFAPMSMVYDLPPWAAVALPIALCWAAGWYGIRRLS